jgi:hypothetical protein
VEVACRSSRCGKRPGVTILHKFNTKTGALVSTRMFRNPTEEVNNNDHQFIRSPVRSA